MNTAKPFLNKTIPLGTYFDIPVKMHWSMIFMVGIIYSIGYNEYFKPRDYLMLGVFMAILFLCVTLHEYGHALMARHFGVSTKDIILSPVGGVARLSHIPKNSKQELKIAIAGPLVNLVIFAILALPIGIMIMTGYIDLNVLNGDLKQWESFLITVAIANAVLFAFNLIPAFPMDGGRILRSLIGMRTSHLRATIIASRIGMAIAMVGFAAGIYYNHYMWSVLAIFIFGMANLETSYLRKEVRFNNTKAIDIASNNIVYVYLHHQMQKVIDLYFEVGDKDFLVLNHAGKVIGMVTKESIEGALRSNSKDELVSNFVTQRYGIVNAEEGINDIIIYMRKNNYSNSLVMSYGEVLGIITRDDLNAFIQHQNSTQSLFSRFKR